MYKRQVLISDHEYPHRVAHTLITKVLDEFSAVVPSHEWPTATEASITFPQINMYLAKYQNPREADAMTKIQEELDETKIILVRLSRNYNYLITVIIKTFVYLLLLCVKNKRGKCLSLIHISLLLYFNYRYKHNPITRILNFLVKINK